MLAIVAEPLEQRHGLAFHFLSLEDLLDAVYIILLVDSA